MKINFTKMNGLGNDFVIIDDRQKYINLQKEQIIKLADRSNSITKGCDQVIVLEPKTNPKAYILMRIYNPDGSEAQSCGNATRCVARLLLEELIIPRVCIETIERLLLCGVVNSDVSNDGTSKYSFVEVHMGKAVSYEKIDLGNEYAELGQAISVNVGNPHCIFIVDNAEAIDLEYWGEKIEKHEAFPERTNVEFVSEIKNDVGAFRVRVWERGAGITKACGSGAVAVSWALEKEGLKNRLSNNRYLDMDGGTITTNINSDEISMSGLTEFEFKGEIDL